MQNFERVLSLNSKTDKCYHTPNILSNIFKITSNSKFEMNNLAITIHSINWAILPKISIANFGKVQVMTIKYPRFDPD